jgi:DNA-directed RNA polymerase subunit RPC12/RpoP
MLDPTSSPHRVHHVADGTTLVLTRILLGFAAGRGRHERAYGARHGARHGAWGRPAREYAGALRYHARRSALPTKSSPEYFRRLRERALAKGMCGHCRGRPAVPGRTMCRECLDRMAAKQRERRERWQRENMCRDCGKQKEEERKHLRLCSTCAPHHVSATDKMRDTRLSEDKCLTCGRQMLRYDIEAQNKNPSGTRYTNCPACSKKNSARTQFHRERRGSHG